MVSSVHSDGDRGGAFTSGTTEHTAELAFNDGDDQLPWLDSDDDYEDRSVDTARIVILAVIGLVVIALLAGGIWWATHNRQGSQLVADGATIHAPEGPYKTKPVDAGGKTFEGTGDTSFAVAEGKTREGKIAMEPARPSIDLEDSSPPASQAAPSPAAAGGVGVQVGAYSNRSSAEKGWQTLLGQFEALHGVSHRIVEGQADIGRVFRLQAVAGDVASANRLCEQLKASGGACQVKR